MSRPSRRDVLGAGTFTLLTGIAVAAIAKPDGAAKGVTSVHTLAADAELITLCERCCALAAQIDQLFTAAADPSSREQHANEAACEPLDDQRYLLIERLAEMEPITAQGRTAYARVALWNVGRKADGTIATDMVGEELAWKLVKQLAGGDVLGGHV